MERRDCKYYDDRAGCVNLEDITSSENNANILQKLRDGDPNWVTLFIDDELEEENDFVAGDGDDCGWLGYFIGRSLLLQELHIWHFPQETAQIDLFVEGLNRNQSIDKLAFCADNGDIMFEKMTPFFRNNHNLHHLELQCDIGHELERILTSLTPMLDYMSLKTFCLEGRAVGDENSLTDEDGIVVDMIKALSKQTQLKVLHLKSCNIGRNGCEALGSLLNSRVSNLKDLSLSENSIDDEGLESLVLGVTGCSNLTKLRLVENRQISTRGLVSLSTLFQSKYIGLEHVSLSGIRIDDDGAKALADGLVGNKSLKALHFSSASVTSSGWSSFSRLLCDTSSVNNTYLSNHKLEQLESFWNASTPPEIVQYLRINRRREHVAIYKILMSHSDFNMEPLFRWKLKFLPLIVAWFDERDDTLDFMYLAELYDSFEVDKVSARMGSRKLSAVYQFIRGMPLLVVDCYRDEKIGTKKRKLDQRD
jgi:hypothetical protein